MRHATRGQDRHGVSIIECVVCLGIGSIMLGMCIALLHVLLDADRNAANAARYNQSLARLSDVWRNDVHASTRADRVPGNAKHGSRLVLDLPTATVSYEIDHSTLIRLERAGVEGKDAEQRTIDQAAAKPDAVAAEAAKIRHRDRFHFPPGSSIAFESGASVAEKQPERADVAAAARPGVVRVTITWPHGLQRGPGVKISSAPAAVDQAASAQPPANSAGRVFQLEATLGRDHRFEKPSIGAKP